MGKPATGQQTQTFSMNVIGSNSYTVCKNCGMTLARNRVSIACHNRFCGKPKKDKSRRMMKCLKVFSSNAKIHIFYYKGMIHAINGNVLSKLAGIDHNTANNRIKKGWTYNQLLGIDQPPKTKSKYNPRNTLGTKNAKCKKMPKEVLNRQEMMKKLFIPNGSK